MDLRDVGLHRARSFGFQTQVTVLAHSADDAADHYHVQRPQHARRVEHSATVQLLFLPMVDPKFGYAFDKRLAKKPCSYVRFRPTRKSGSSVIASMFIPARNTGWWTTPVSGTRLTTRSFLSVQPPVGPIRGTSRCSAVSSRCHRP